jgi:hypothetical protein
MAVRIRIRVVARADTASRATAPIPVASADRQTPTDAERGEATPVVKTTGVAVVSAGVG